MTEPTALTILEAARAKIAKPEDWGKGARRERPRFASCCAGEAIEECGIDIYQERVRAFRALRNAAGIENEWKSLTDWNDAPERTHAEVLAAFNLAIATVRLA